MGLHLRKAVDILFVSCLVVGLSTCATYLIEDTPKPAENPDDEPVKPTGPWQLDDATVEAMVKSGNLVINWLDPATIVEDLNTRTTIGEGGTGGTDISGINPVEVDLATLLKIYRAKWDSLTAKIEPRPYVFSKGTATELKDYKTDRVKEVYDWWFYDGKQNFYPDGSFFQHWRMRESHEAKNVILVVDRYWNNAEKGGWKHSDTLGLDEDKAKWMQQPYAERRLQGYRTMYKEIDKFRVDYRTLLDRNKLYYSGALAETLALLDSDPQKAPSLLYKEIDLFLKSNVDSLNNRYINESVYNDLEPISEIYPGDSPDGRVFGKFSNGTKTLDSLGYAWLQNPNLPSTHPEAPDLYPTFNNTPPPSVKVVFTKGVARRGMLFEFFLGNINGPQKPRWYSTATLPKEETMYVTERKKFTIIPDDPTLPPLKVKWSSSAPDTVSVDSITGVVTARKKGNAPVIIKAKLNSGDSLFCTVKVKIPDTWFISSTGSDTKADGTPNSGFYPNEPLATPQFALDGANNPHSMRVVYDSVVNNAGMTWPTESMGLYISGLVMEKGNARPNDGMLNIASVTPFPTIELRGNPANPGALHANFKHRVLTVNDTVRLAPGVTLRGGAAVDSGGGVYVAQGLFAMSGGEISSNTATRKGGGVYVTATGKFEMSGGKIVGTQRWNNSGVETAIGRNTTTSGYAASLFVEIRDSAVYKDWSDSPTASGAPPPTDGNILHAMDYNLTYTDCTLPSARDSLPSPNPSGDVAVTPNGGSPTRYTNLADAIAVVNVDPVPTTSYEITVLKNLRETNTFAFTRAGISVTLSGDTITLAQSNSRSLFTIRDGATLTLNNITLKGVSNNGAAMITVDGPNAEFVMNAGSTITGNRNISVNNYGGGAVLVKNGTFTMNDGIIEANAAGLGGGVYVVGDIGDGAFGTFYMGGGKIYGTLLPSGLGPEPSVTPAVSNVFIGIGLGASLVVETKGVAEYIAPSLHAGIKILPAADLRGNYYTDCTLPAP
ncbi:hypothetical protein AGMMS49965_01470 [Bacteroidia bacterium]|nr:hypothetical protein AGMMS49965_01470 [Bacteroidia bacterium]